MSLRRYGVWLSTAIPEQGRLTDSAVYVLPKKEILAAALPGGFPKQAPRFPTAVLAALGGVVSDQSVVQYFRIYSWWILVQCWGTLRFFDHRGNPTSRRLTRQ